MAVNEGPSNCNEKQLKMNKITCQKLTMANNV